MCLGCDFLDVCLPGSNEPLDFDEIKNGLWAFAETPLDGRTDDEKGALTMLWACEGYSSMLHHNLHRALTSHYR